MKYKSIKEIMFYEPDRDGITQMVDYEGYGGQNKAVDVFESTLVFCGTGKGRSAVRFYLLDEDKKIRYSMSLSSFANMIDAGAVISNKKVVGKWDFAKQGANTTLVYVPPAKTKE
jgi:hypothetical protein